MARFLDYSADNLWDCREIQVGIIMFRKFRTVLAAAAFIVATYAAAAEMAGPHPDTYVVKRGDTLWDISGKFLKKPWLWPEIWQANPQIKNPHLIYPGDVISLAYLDRVAIQPGPRQEAPIGAIPLADIEPFLKNLRVVDSFEELPRVVGLEDDRLHAMAGQMVYVLGLDGAQVGQRYAIVRAEPALYPDPFRLRWPLRHLQGRPGLPRQARRFADHRLGARLEQRGAGHRPAARIAGIRADASRHSARSPAAWSRVRIPATLVLEGNG